MHVRLQNNSDVITVAMSAMLIIADIGVMGIRGARKGSFWPVMMRYHPGIKNIIPFRTNNAQIIVVKIPDARGMNMQMDNGILGNSAG